MRYAAVALPFPNPLCVTATVAAKWKCKFSMAHATTKPHCTATFSPGPAARARVRARAAQSAYPLQQFNFLSNFHNLLQIVSECCCRVSAFAPGVMEGGEGGGV